MSGELDARPPVGGPVLRSPLPDRPALQTTHAGDEDAAMHSFEAGDETEDEGRGEDGSIAVDGSRLKPPQASSSAFNKPRGLQTPSSAPAHLAAGNNPNGWRTPPAPAPRRSPPGSGPSEEAAALLLNFSAVAPQPMPTIAEREPGPSYPRTPPHDSPNIGAPSAPSVVSVSSNQTPSSPAGLPTPSAPSPDAPSSSSKPPKKKRKRNAAAGPSRHSSTEAHGGTDERPPHWMGADNTLIRCICGLTEDDGFTVLCERCNAWEHALCFGYRDESRLPDVFLCELCLPRTLPFTSEQARGLQLQARANYDARRGLATPTEETEQRKRPKTKRPRPAESVTKETPEATEETRDSPGGMGPPTSTKPKRRSHPGKPRSTAASLKDAQEDEEYFRILPWELEYTPLKDNLLRGRACRQAMTQLYHEWADGEDEAPRKSRPVYHDSGLPSPTDTGLRLSPDLLSPPDFSILAPPVPPVFLSGPSLSTLEASTTIRQIEESASACYLPLKYIEPSSGIYPRPTLYGVFALDQINLGGFVGEFRGEILDAASYRLDPINQYSALGVPKPYVRSVGPPVNLILDARSYGNEMRFVRSGCHPNAVIRPIFFRADDSNAPKLRFGIFAAREIGRNEEIILGWEWDDQHVVHTLRAVIDSTLKNSANKPGIPSGVMDILGTKFDAILTNIFGTFQSCACTVTTDCAFSQMRRLVNGQTFHGVSGQRARKRIDLGELLGAVRGWRRRELEEAAAAKARQYRSSGEWEVWRAGPGKDESDEEMEEDEEEAEADAEPSRPQSEADEEEPVEEKIAVEEEVAEDEKPEEEEKPDGEEPEEVAVEVEVAAEPEPEPLVVTAPDQVDPDETDDEGVQAAAPEETMDVDPVVTRAALPVEAPMEAKPKVEETDGDGDAVMAAVTEPPVTPVTATQPPQEAPSSALSSLPRATQEEGEDELSGAESDATEVTVVRSDSNSEPESEAEVGVRPAATRRGRRVLSPSGETSSGSLTPPEKPKKQAPAPPKSKPGPGPPPKAAPAPMPPTSTPPRPANDRKRRSRKNVIASSDEDSSADESEVAAPSPPKRARGAPAQLRAKKKQRKEISDESESEKEREREKEKEKEKEKDAVRRKTKERERTDRSERADSERTDRTDRTDRKGKDKAKDKPSSKNDKDREEKREEKDREEKRLEREKQERKAERAAEKERVEKEKEKERAEKEKTKEAKAELEKERAAKAEREKEERRAERERELAERADKKAEAERERADKDKKEKSKDKSDRPDRSDKDKSKDKSEKRDKAGSEKPVSDNSSSDTASSAKAVDKPSETTAVKPDTGDKPELTEDVKMEDATPETKPVSKSASEAPEPAASTPAEVTEAKATPEPEAKPAPKEPPPKKVSMKEYLATHKIRKNTNPAAELAPEPPVVEEKKEEEPEKEAPAPVEPETKPVLSVSIAANNARLNLLEHLPSRGGAPALGTPFTPSAPRPSLTTSTPSSAYVPRTSDHLPTPSVAYAPRPSPSYVPRALDEPVTAGVPPAFVPRDDHKGPGLSPVNARVPLPPAQTPPRPSHSLPDMPSALGVREGPPHHSTPGYGPRAVPTGPRVPPTGPRNSWGAGPSPGSGPNPPPGGPVSPVAPLRPPYPPRGGFGGGRGTFGDRGGGWNRGRGFRGGRGRGM